ncbi:hypothetical protein Ddc_10247 [Ditylenchus destructor]|nr:hypothetical protein Ddc_10247 [Ditylenchus destructor]
MNHDSPGFLPAKTNQTPLDQLVNPSLDYTTGLLPYYLPIPTSVCCGFARVRFKRFTTAVSHFLLSSLSIFNSIDISLHLCPIPSQQQPKATAIQSTLPHFPTTVQRKVSNIMAESKSRGMKCPRAWELQASLD